MKKKCFLLICAAAAALCLCSCAKNQDGGHGTASDGQIRYRYVREEISLPVSGTYLVIYDITACDDQFFIFCGTMDDNDDNIVQHNFVMDISGNLLIEYPTLSSTDDSFIGFPIDYCLMENGELITLESKTGYDRVNGEIQPNWDNTGFTIAVRKASGQITAEYPLDSRLKDPYQIECRGEQICICADRSLAVYDLSGALLYFYESKGRIDSACFMADGAVAVLESGDEYAIGDKSAGQRLLKINAEGQTAEEFMPLDGNAVKLISGAECAFYIDNGSALLGVDSDSKETFEILNWTASGVNGINAAVQSLGDGRFLYYDAYTTFLLKPSSVPYDQMVTLKLGTMDAYSVADIASDFNASSERVQIEVVDYSQYDSADGSTTGLDRLELDILSGNGPDIYDLLTLPRKQYEKAGRLVDLHPFMEKDDTLKNVELLPELLTQTETEGKLYTLIPVYGILTLTGDPDIIGTDAPLTLAEMLGLYDKMGEGENPFGIAMSKKDYIDAMVSLSDTVFVDWENRSCNFDSDQFAALLEFAARLPDIGDTSDQINMVYTGKQLLSQREIFNIYDLVAFNCFFHENMKLYGMPSAEKGGTAIKPYVALGISVDCEDKEGAWSFIRTFLYDQYQTELAGRALPATKTGFDSIINDYMAWVSAGGRMHTIDPFGNDVTIQETDGRIADRLRNAISSVSCVYDNNTALTDLIWKEAQPFFAGGKTAAQTADIIQSKAAIYIAEQT